MSASSKILLAALAAFLVPPGGLRAEDAPRGAAIEANVQQRIAAYDPGGRFLRWHGAVPHEALAAHYAAAELFVYASSCENLPNILVEAMAAGLPIACSDRGPMPEVLGDAGAYFSPEDPDSLAALLRDLAADAPRRDGLAARAFVRAERFESSRVR